jgi:hypothetical protein
VAPLPRCISVLHGNGAVGVFGLDVRGGDGRVRVLPLLPGQQTVKHDVLEDWYITFLSVAVWGAAKTALRWSPFGNLRSQTSDPDAAAARLRAASRFQAADRIG